MEIKKEIKKVKIAGQFTDVEINVGRLTLGVSPKDGTMTLLFVTKKEMVHLLCDHFKRLGNINRYAKCYGIEFER